LELNKSVLITGVSGGIGSACAAAFKEAGWTVAGIDIKGKRSKQCDLFIKADVSNPRSVRKASVEVRKRSASLQCLINNAAFQVEKTLLETTEKEWNRVLGTNVNPIFYITKCFIRMLDNASIINISSVHSRATSKGLAAYVASKGAVSALTRAMALELAEYGIRVNAILPGAIKTSMLEKGLKRSKDFAKALSALIEVTPLKKVGSPEDIAEIALFLADGSKSGFITGQEFVCDGGVLARLASE
jgi:NAD(P)-dependent dehydrogenase (short-subunit alcohol dehydrogenase family)